MLLYLSKHYNLLSLLQSILRKAITDRYLKLTEVMSSQWLSQYPPCSLPLCLRSQNMRNDSSFTCSVPATTRPVLFTATQLKFFFLFLVSLSVSDATDEQLLVSHTWTFSGLEIITLSLSSVASPVTLSLHLQLKVDVSSFSSFWTLTLPSSSTQHNDDWSRRPGNYEILFQETVKWFTYLDV